VLKGQDVLAAIYLAVPGDRDRTYPKLASALRMSASEAHAAVKRAVKSGLVDEASRTARRSALSEFLVHGLRYMIPPLWTGSTRGIPTSYAAAPLSSSISGGSELPPIWPHPNGETRGQGLAPIYTSVPEAALGNATVYELLALVDAIRSGRARERELAVRLLEKRLM
jgi:hypothetical protein